MVPVGLIGALELPNNLEDIWLPPIHILRFFHFASPRCCLKGLAGLGGLCRRQILSAGNFDNQTYSHVSAKNQLVNNRYKLEMWLKDRVCAGVLFLRKTRDSIVKSIQDIVHFHPL
jgi:hypothetical protein